MLTLPSVASKSSGRFSGVSSLHSQCFRLDVLIGNVMVDKVLSVLLEYINCFASIATPQWQRAMHP